MVSKTRRIAASVAIPISHAIVGAAGGFGAVALVNPSQEFQAGPIVIEQTIGVGSTSTFSGESLFEAPPFSVDVDLKIIDRADTPKAIQDIKDIYTTEDGSPTTQEITDAINNKFEKPFTNSVRNLALQTFGVFAFGATIAMRTRAHIFDLIKRGSIHTINGGIHLTNWTKRKFAGSDGDPHQFREIELPQRPPTKLSYGGFVAGFGRDIALGTLMGTLAILTTGSQIKLDKVQPRIEQIASQPVREYLLTGTSKMVPNFAAINDQLAVQLNRINGISEAIEDGSQSLLPDKGEEKTFLIISDPHNLPTAPQLIEAIARAARVDGVIILGDFLNTGAQFEVDSLRGYSIGENYFQGFDDIRTCVEFIRDNCTKEGDPFDVYAVLGNHDTSTLMTTLGELGIKSLVTDPPEIFEGQIALDDACFVEDPSCQGGRADEANIQNATELRDSIDFTDERADRPTIGFFASSQAAKVFEDELNITIFGGQHRFTQDTSDGQTTIGVGAIGAGFPRVAEYSNATIMSFTREPNGVQLSQCLDARWDVFDLSKGISLQTCRDT